MAFIAWRFQPADLLLGYLDEPREVHLGKPGLFSKGGDLERHVPVLSGAFETGGKRPVLQLLFDIFIEIGLFHPAGSFVA